MCADLLPSQESPGCTDWTSFMGSIVTAAAKEGGTASVEGCPAEPPRGKLMAFECVVLLIKKDCWSRCRGVCLSRSLSSLAFFLRS